MRASVSHILRRDLLSLDSFEATLDVVSHFRVLFYLEYSILLHVRENLWDQSSWSASRVVSATKERMSVLTASVFEG